MIADSKLQGWMAAVLHMGNRRKLPRYFKWPDHSKGELEDFAHYAATPEGKRALHAELTRALNGN